MPRANRHFLPDRVWHITHRCHQREFLLKFARNRERYLHGLFEAKQRVGLCVLNDMVTSNHIHLLVKDTDRNEFAGGSRSLLDAYQNELPLHVNTDKGQWRRQSASHPHPGQTLGGNMRRRGQSVARPRQLANDSTHATNHVKA